MESLSAQTQQQQRNLGFNQRFLSSTSYEENSNNIELKPLIVGHSQIIPDYFNTPQMRKQGF